MCNHMYDVITKQSYKKQIVHDYESFFNIQLVLFIQNSISDLRPPPEPTFIYLVRHVSTCPGTEGLETSLKTCLRCVHSCGQTKPKHGPYLQTVYARSLGLGEILDKMKFYTLNFASYVFGSKIQFYNILQSNYFDSRLF